MPESKNYASSVTTNKKRDNVTRQRQRTRTRICSCGLRPSTREPSSMPLACPRAQMLKTVYSQHMCRTLFVLCCVFLEKKHLPTSTWARTHAHHVSSLVFLAPAIIALRTSTCPERRQVRCCRTHLHVAKILFLAMSVQTHDARQETPTFAQVL